MQNSRNVIVSWRMVRGEEKVTVVHCYHLAADYQTVEVIKEIESVKHYVSSLHNIEGMQFFCALIMYFLLFLEKFLISVPVFVIIFLEENIEFFSTMRGSVIVIVILNFYCGLKLKIKL